MTRRAEPPELQPPAPPERRDLVRGFSWVGAGHVVSQLTWFGSLFYLAAVLPPAAVGSVTIAMVLVQVAWLLQNSGLTGSIIVAPTLSAAQVRHALAVSTVTGVVSAALVAVFARPLLTVVGADPGDADILRVLALSIAVNGLSIVPMALLQKNMLFKRHAAANGGAAIASSVLAVVLGVLGAGVWALVVRQVALRTLVTAFAWVGARGIVLWRAGPAGGPRRQPLRSGTGRWFFALSLTSFVALQVDYVVISHEVSVTELGLYSLAFTIAFAPMTQFAWQICKVLLPSAAATVDPAVVRSRALKAVRLTGLVLLPLVPLTAGLAPVLLPRVLGSEWEPMVIPFQILFAVGVAHALLSILREFLVATGSVDFCAKTDLLWLSGTVVTLLALVAADGIRGAALAHLAMLVPLLAAYATRGAGRLGLRARDLGSSLAGVVVPVAAQSAATVLGIATLEALGTDADVARLLGVALGAGVLGVALLQVPDGPLADGRRLLGRASGRGRQPEAAA